MVDINSSIEYKKRGTKPQKCRFPLQIQGKLAFSLVQNFADFSAISCIKQCKNFASNKNQTNHIYLTNKKDHLAMVGKG